MAAKNIVKAIPIASLDTAANNGAYRAFTALPNACFAIRIINISNTAQLISYDGATDNDYVAATSILQLSFQDNAQPNNFVSVLPTGTTIYIKSAAGVGLVYLVGYYQPMP